MIVIGSGEVWPRFFLWFRAMRIDTAEGYSRRINGIALPWMSRRRNYYDDRIYWMQPILIFEERARLRVDWRCLLISTSVNRWRGSHED